MLLAAAAALGGALPASAQESGDRARLDDFALPQDDAALRVEQLDGGDRAIAPPESSTGDRELAIPGPPQVERAPVTQLSQPGQTAPAQQLSERSDSRQLAAGSVSTISDSRPQAGAPLAGNDRCDRQLDREELEQCLRILERRAAEFDAPEAPRLSAEQALLAARGDDDEFLATSSSDLRVRLAADDPDADIASNQELASILIDRRTEALASAEAAAAEQPDDATLAQILETLQIQGPGVVGQ